MLLPRAVQIYVATSPVRLNRWFDGRAAVVRQQLGHDPRCGHVCVFLNRRRTMVKLKLRLMVWIRGGKTMIHPRLKRGTFADVFTEAGQHGCVELDGHELSMSLEGLVPSRSRGARRWQPRRWVAGTRRAGLRRDLGPTDRPGGL